MTCADTWTASLRRPQSETWLTDAVFGKSHADPAVRRMSKPTLDLTYPAYAVGETDSDNEVTRVAAVTGLRSDQNQLEDLLWRVILTAERPEKYGKTVTTVGEGATESATCGCRPSSTDDNGTDVALFPRWTAPTAMAASTTAATSETATVPEGLVGRNVFLLWEDGPCSDTLSGI